ncbi:MAG: chemotaxis protein, partial [Actinomycetota bacterium]
HACVSEVSHSLQDQRYTRLLRQASEMAPRARLENILARRVQGGGESDSRLSDLRRQLRRSLEDVTQLVELGGVLAKSAKIEAAYGQGHAAALTQVSGEFDGIVDEIRRSLESLRKSTFFTGH